MADKWQSAKIYRELDIFKEHSDVIIANRITDELADVGHKVYTRDVYVRD